MSPLRMPFFGIRDAIGIAVEQGVRRVEAVESMGDLVFIRDAVAVTVGRSLLNDRKRVRDIAVFRRNVASMRVPFTSSTSRSLSGFQETVEILEWAALLSLFALANTRTQCR